jgi:hypothetical protein
VWNSENQRVELTGQQLARMSSFRFAELLEAFLTS